MPPFSARTGNPRGDIDGVRIYRHWPGEVHLLPAVGTHQPGVTVGSRGASKQAVISFCRCRDQF